MLLAYIDEIGETGAFVSPSDRRYKTSAAFGYGGFVIPAENARQFGAEFTKSKREVFAALLEKAEHPGRWEFKGAQVFHPTGARDYPQQLRAFDHLVKRIKQLASKFTSDGGIRSPSDWRRDAATSSRPDSTGRVRPKPHMLCVHGSPSTTCGVSLSPSTILSTAVTCRIVLCRSFIHTNGVPAGEIHGCNSYLLGVSRAADPSDQPPSGALRPSGSVGVSR